MLLLLLDLYVVGWVPALQVTLVRIPSLKSLLADGTLVWLLASVPPLVLLQNPIADKSENLIGWSSHQLHATQKHKTNADERGGNGGRGQRREGGTEGGGNEIGRAHV